MRAFAATWTRRREGCQKFRKLFQNGGERERERERERARESLSVCRALLHSNTSDVGAAAAAKKLKFATESVELNCLDFGFAIYPHPCNSDGPVCHEKKNSQIGVELVCRRRRSSDRVSQQHNTTAHNTTPKKFSSRCPLSRFAKNSIFLQCLLPLGCSSFDFYL